ncbi:MAG: BON domain-containing protein [Abitibacteriaceae bacterium]|nr:BON domain-containing protein [Abditibacteriaceae bacterium]MBV9867189.1 BON domain-containing protein [Abditibacteriaceae bacterium]
MLGIFRRKPPSRMELVKRGVTERAEYARDTLGDAWSHVPVDRLDDVKHSIADTAAQAWDAVTHTAENVAQRAADSDVLKTAADRANAAREAAVAAREAAVAARETAAKVAAAKAAAARDTAQSFSKDAAAEAAKKASLLRDTAADVTGKAKDRAFSLKDQLTNRAREQAQDQAENIANTTADIKSAAKAKVKKAKSRIPDRDELVESAVDRIPGGEIETHEGLSKWLWIGLGVLIGIAIGILIAPKAGRRTRAVVKEKLNQAGQEAANLGTTAASKTADLGSRAAGVVHTAKNAASGEEDDADDNTIADRVRTALGENEATRNLERINVDCVDGVVTLRGPMLEEAVQKAVEGVVQGVKGVRTVRSEFLTDNAPEDSATFVG